MIFQASKRLKNFRKGQLKNIDTLQTGGALGDIDVTDLIDEAKGSDLWKEAVRDTVLANDIGLNHHACLLHN